MRKLPVVLAAAAAAVVVAAVGRGAIPDGNTIHGCFKNDSGVLRVIDAAAGGTCNAKSESALDWVQTGSPGVQGTQGDRGADGTPGGGGPDGVSSYQIESATGTTTGQGSAGDVVVQASCPNGTVPTGGGFDVPPSANVGVVYNDATSSTWRVEVAGDVGVTVTVYAVCVDKQQWEGA